MPPRNFGRPRGSSIRAGRSGSVSNAIAGCDAPCRGRAAPRRPDRGPGPWRRTAGCRPPRCAGARPRRPRGPAAGAPPLRARPSLRPPRPGERAARAGAETTGAACRPVGREAGRAGATGAAAGPAGRCGREVEAFPALPGTVDAPAPGAGNSKPFAASAGPVRRPGARVGRNPNDRSVAHQGQAVIFSPCFLKDTFNFEGQRSIP